MSVDPRARARVQSVSVRPSVRADLSNTDLADAFVRSLQGKLAAPTIEHYGNAVRDAIRYFRTPEGAEIPVRRWTKAEVWGYVHFVESSYCANFRQVAFRAPARAACEAGAWEGYKPAEDAAAAHCAECPLFRKSPQGVKKRLHGLNRFFSYLARVGVVPVNFVRDVSEEWFHEEAPQDDAGERKRNPTREEMVCLVNGTAHPARRAFFACSAKWGCRPNEMLRLDRYASFGLPMPEGHKEPAGFRYGFAVNPQTLPFDQGGQLVYLPERMSELGVKLSEKRQGNRWLVVDAELRPILEQYLAWWERHVRRDPVTGAPVTTALWLNEWGTGEEYDERGRPPYDFNQRWFYREAERLGLMGPGDRKDPLRRWAAHCQRHFFEQVCEMEEVPPDWCNHFRGDVFRDSRNFYFSAKPEQVLEKYLRWIPVLGFKPLPEAPRLRGVAGAASGRTEAESHRLSLLEQARKLRALKTGYTWTRVARVVVIHPDGRDNAAASQEKPEAWTVPQRVAGSVRFALQAAHPERAVRVEPLEGRHHGRAEEYARLLERAVLMLTPTESTA